MVAGGVRCVVWMVVCVVAVVGFHPHHPFSRPQETTYHEKERRHGPAQADSGAEIPEPEAKGQQGSSHERLRRYLGDSHIGLILGQDDLEDRASSRPALVVCEQLLILRHASPNGRTVACTFSERLMTPEAKASQVDRWQREAQAAVHFVTVGRFMDVVEACLKVESSPPPTPPQWSFVSLVQGRAPGTLWCGMGQTAQDLTELGALAAVDHCCRLHDLCPVQLPPFVYYRGAINTTPKPLSHCECDLLFAVCLNKINDQPANIIFNIYFNLLFRGGFCATMKPRTPRMGLSRAFGSLWTQIRGLLQSFTGSRKKKKTRRQRRRTVSEPITIKNSFRHPSTTSLAVSAMHLLLTATPISSSSSPCCTITTAAAVQTKKSEATLKPESTSSPLERAIDSCIPYHLTAQALLDAELTTESTSTTSGSSSPTPPLPHTNETNETLPHVKNTVDANNHTLEKPLDVILMKEESPQHRHEQKTDSTDEGPEVQKGKKASSRRLTESSTRGDESLLIVSFRSYLEKFDEEEEKEEEEQEEEEEEEEAEEEKVSESISF